MGVFTPVAEATLRELLACYDLGTLREFHGIADGVENTNYLVRTDRHELVLTLFEQLTASQLPPIFRLLRQLAAAGLTVPQPLPDRSGRLLHTLHERPAQLALRLPGRSVAAPGIAECAAVGRALGRMHLAAQALRLPANHRGPNWWRRAAAALTACLSPTEQVLLRSELEYQRCFHSATLPRGPIHGDLFRDNVLFDGAVIGGLLDFFAAADDVLLFDVAIAVNDWCSRAGRLLPRHTEALLSAYHAVRPFTGEEGRLWPVLLRAAALRFWLSRLQDGAAGKDPAEFERLLRRHRADAPLLRSVWGRAVTVPAASRPDEMDASNWYQNSFSVIHKICG